MNKQVMTRAGVSLLLVAVLVLTGCGDKPAAQQGDRSAPEPQQPKPARDTREVPADHALADNTPAGGTQAPSAHGDRSTQPALGVDANAGRVATLGGVARLPFPDIDERVTRPYPAVRLSNHDTFAKDIDPDNIPDVVPWTEAGDYVGHEITVEGRIVNLGQSRDGNVNFLNFDPDWRGKFYMVVFNDLAETLEGGVEGTFLNKLVRVTGEVEDHRGRPQIQITSMDQVEFVDE